MMGPVDTFTGIVETSEGPVRGFIPWGAREGGTPRKEGKEDRAASLLGEILKGEKERNLEGEGSSTSAPPRNIEKFHGIPFAEPPLGRLRFRPPVPLSSVRSKVFDAIRLPTPCPQMKLSSGMYLGDEDCLQLSVYRPRGSKHGDNLPVLVWIFQGGFSIGDSYGFGGYDGGRLSEEHGIVVVCVNYRLGFLGFLALPELLEESGTFGNYGVQDQQAALRWVQKNIFNFGGNPKNVMLYGQSAGAFSIVWHLVNPASKKEKLFHSAALQSASTNLSYFFQPKEWAVKFYESFTTYFLGRAVGGKRRVEELRRAKPSELVHSIYRCFKDYLAGAADDFPIFASPLFPVMPFGPVIDGTALGLSLPPIDLISAGAFHDVPLLMSVTSDEGSLLAPVMAVVSPLQVTSPKEWVLSTLHWIVGNQRIEEEILEAYRDYLDEEEWLLAAQRVLRDLVFSCSSKVFAEAYSEKSRFGVWFSVFSFSFPEGMSGSVGNFHTSDIPFIFRNAMFDLMKAGGGRKKKEELSLLSGYMSCAWINMLKCAPAAERDEEARAKGPLCSSKCGIPGVKMSALPAWPAFKRGDRAYLSWRQEGGEGEGGGPVLKRMEEDNVFSMSEPYSDEFPSLHKCGIIEQAYPMTFFNIRERKGGWWKSPKWFDLLVSPSVKRRGVQVGGEDENMLNFVEDDNHVESLEEGGGRSAAKGSDFGVGFYFLFFCCVFLLF